MSEKILILTALALEFHEVEKYLNGTEIVKHSDGIFYTKGFYNTREDYKYEILLVETGAGNIRAANETSRAIEYFNPDNIFFIGVAGGIKDVSIGDVVASTKVIGFEFGKSDDEFKPRNDTVPANYKLEQLARYVKREQKWFKNNDEAIGRSPKSHVGPIASGEKVISSTKSKVFENLRRFNSDALAVDMEGSGFMLAARPKEKRAIEIRGISDLIDGKSEADEAGSQPLAAKHAAQFAFEMIENLTSENIPNLKLDSTEKKNKLVEMLVGLYEKGPEDKNIWKRAGGDVSILSNSTSRSSQWYDAIDTLSKGGGGETLSFVSLMDQVKKDFPNSDKVEEFN